MPVSEAATVAVVGVRTHSKIQAGCRTHPQCWSTSHLVTP